MGELTKNSEFDTVDIWRQPAQMASPHKYFLVCTLSGYIVEGPYVELLFNLFAPHSSDGLKRKGLFSTISAWKKDLFAPLLRNFPNREINLLLYSNIYQQSFFLPYFLLAPHSWNFHGIFPCLYSRFLSNSMARQKYFCEIAFTFWTSTSRSKHLSKKARHFNRGHQSYKDQKPPLG